MKYSGVRSDSDDLANGQIFRNFPTSIIRAYVNLWAHNKCNVTRPCGHGIRISRTLMVSSLVYRPWNVAPNFSESVEQI